jgi:hypothetical protein
MALVMGHRQVDAQATLGFGVTETSLSANGGGASTAGTAFATNGQYISYITWTVAWSVAPASDTILLQGSLDNSTWFTVDTSTNVNGELRSIGTSAKFVRAFVSAQSGVANVTVTLVAKSTAFSNLYNATFVGQSLFADGSNTAPSITFNSTPALGLYRYSASQIGFAVSSGTTAAILGGNGFYVNSNGLVGFANSSTDPASGIDVRIGRASAGQLYYNNGASVQAIVNGTFNTGITPACTIADTNETTLFTYTLPASALNSNGRGLRITAWGTMAATATTKTIKGYFGATVTANPGAAVYNGVSWRMTYEILRLTATTQTSGALSTVGAILLTGNTSPGETLANAIVIKVTGQNGTANLNDICFSGAVVEAIN